MGGSPKAARIRGGAVDGGCKPVGADPDRAGPLGRRLRFDEQVPHHLEVERGAELGAVEREHARFIRRETNDLRLARLEAQVDVVLVDREPVRGVQRLLDEVNAQATRLRQQRSALIDSRSRDTYGYLGRGKAQVGRILKVSRIGCITVQQVNK